jgi:hypothetical protein
MLWRGSWAEATALVAHIRAQLVELVADLLVERRQEPALVRRGIEVSEIGLVSLREVVVQVIKAAETYVQQQFELCRVREEKLLVTALLLELSQLCAAGVRLAEGEEAE